MKKVYFAGKVKKDGFRQQLMGSRIMSEGSGTVVNIDGGTLIYAGPNAISDDHGCWHNKGYDSSFVHALSYYQSEESMFDYKKDFQQEYTCCEYNKDGSKAPLSNSDVVKRCFWQIDNCDAVYAYIDAPDCYGTLVELGYANANGKPIYLVFNVEKISGIIGTHEDPCVESAGHYGGAFLSDCYLINNTFVPEPYSCYYSPEDVFVQDMFVNDTGSNVIRFFTKLNNYVDKQQFDFIHNYEDIFFSFSFIEEFFYKNPKYSVKDLLIEIESIHHCVNGEKIAWIKKQMDFAWYFYLAIYGGYISSLSSTDKCCVESGDYVIKFFSLNQELYKDFWFVRNLDTVKNIDFHYPNTAIPFPSELLYFEPKYSVKDILTKLNRTTVNEDNLRELGVIISTEYQERTGQKPHKVNAENKGVSVPVNKYTEKDIGWIAEILKKQTKPNYKKYLSSLLAELNDLLDLAEKEKNIESIVSVLQKTLLEYQDIAIN